MYQEYKLEILQLAGLSRDAVHLYIGLTLFFCGSVFAEGPDKYHGLSTPSTSGCAHGKN